MNFNINETQSMLISSAKEVFSNKYDLKLINKKIDTKSSYLPGWKEFQEQGFMGMLAKESIGGYGYSFHEFSLIMDIWGNYLCSGPIIENSIAGVLTLQKYNESKFSDILKKIIRNQYVITTPLSNQFYEKGNIPEIKKIKNKMYISGSLSKVPFFELSTHIIFIAKQNNIPKIMILPTSKINIEKVVFDLLGNKLVNIYIENNNISDENFIGDDDNTHEIIDFMMNHIIMSKCSEMIGASEAVLNKTIDYIKNREQFGRSLASFQSIQHKISEIFTLISETKELSRYISKIINSNQKKYSSLVKIKCNESLNTIIWDAHQLHGAIGFTWDYGLHLFTRKILMNKSVLGDTEFHSKILLS